MEKNKSLSNDGFISKNSAKAVKEEKKVAKKKDKKPGFFKKIGAKVKDIFSELKKVSWPSFGKIVKETGVVLIVVIAFLLVITGFDYLLERLLQLLK
ncbi:MAG: preprotein translocase subunit SecE [Clostridia bacterium]|nr:preprotein translocase subunit SecE [Clostridia bacterium]